MVCVAPRSTRTHCGSLNALDHRVPVLPSNALAAGKEPFSVDDAVAGRPCARLLPAGGVVGGVVQAPPGASLGYTTNICSQVEEALSKVPEINGAFTVAGFGTVVTGTLLSGMVAAGDTVEVLPPGETVRVREVQVHGRKVERAGAGQRVALNLAGLERAHAAVVARAEEHRTTLQVGGTHGVRAAFTAEPMPVRAGQSIWHIPRYVCGHDWREPEALARILLG